MDRASPSAFRRLFLPALALLLALTACAPPEELNRPEADASARAEDLLPPGGLREPSSDPARVAQGRWGNATMKAERHASATAASQAVARLDQALEAATGVRTRSMGHVGDATYLRYSMSGLSGVAWSSGPWSFAADARTADELAALIRASHAGGLGAGNRAVLLWLPWLIAAGGGILGLGVIWLVRQLMQSAIVEPVPGVAAVPKAALVARLRALAAPDSPFLFKEDGPDRYVLEWNFVDARWADAFAKRGLKESYRLRLRLDEAAHAVLARDETTAVSWDAGLTGAPGISYGTTVTRGAALFSKKRALAYAPTLHGVEKATDFTFDIMDMKGPVIAAVTQSGWRFQPAIKV